MGSYRKFWLPMRAYLSRGAFSAGHMGTLAKAMTMLLACLLLLQVPMGVSAQTMPIIDLHFHADQVWDVQAVVKLFDELGVAAASNGARGADSIALKFAEQYPGRFIPFGGKEEGWRSRGVKIFDLADPAQPRYIRDYGVVGQEPSASGEPVPAPLHEPIRLGNRVYFGYGTNAGGILQIVDRDKLLKGDPTSPNPFAPTAQNILYAQVGRLDISPNVGAHTTLPVLGIQIPEFSKNQRGTTADFVVLVNESTRNECREHRQMVFLVDVTTASKPFPVSNFQVPEASGNFCSRGGRFGAHASNESFTPIYYGRLVFISYFNAGVRAVDIRDPYHPKEVAFYIPAMTEKTDKRCVPIESGGEACKVAIQTNTVEVDDRGYIYIVDRANTGLHILELTGAARAIANFP